MSDITFKHHDPNVMLELWHVTKRFGGLTAVGDVSFKIKKGEIYALIGPNGAGKTTIFNLITGVYALTEGRVIFDGTVVGQGDAIIKDDMREDPRQIVDRLAKLIRGSMSAALSRVRF